MGNKLIQHFIRDVEIEYKHHPRIFWISFLIFMYVIIQSYLVQPRPSQLLFEDLLDLAFLFFPLIYIFWSAKLRSLLIFGTIYLIISIVMWFGIIDFIKPAYETLFFICALWFLGDWFNKKRFDKSLFTELLGGNYY